MDRQVYSEPKAGDKKVRFVFKINFTPAIKDLGHYWAISESRNCITDHGP